MNTFGKIYTLTTFGESHGPAIGGVVDGMPAGIDVDEEFIQRELARRRPGQSRLTSPRHEEDTVQFLSGIFEGTTTGAPIAFLVANNDCRPQDYDSMRDILRPSHADYTYMAKYGCRDHRGGGRSSARGTVSRVVAGALAKLVLRRYGITIAAYTSQIGSLAVATDYRHLDLCAAEQNAVRCPDGKTAQAMEALLREVQRAGDSVGGVVACVVRGCPTGLGEPEAGKLHASLAAAMLSINAAKGFEYGSGFAGAVLRGSQQNDSFVLQEGKITTATNHSGGIQGGISNGQDIYFRVAFKPTATILLPQQTVRTNPLQQVTFTATGRHDPCVVPRAVPIVEAMTAMVVLDALLLRRAQLPLCSSQEML